jgi:hypothetical protein
MKKIEVQEHWQIELQKLRCWISGFRAGRTLPGTVNLESYVPGEDVLRQIVLAISDTKDTKK